MEIFIGVTFAILIIGIILIVILKLKINRKVEETEKEESSLSANDVENTFPNIQIIENTTVVPLEKNKIVDSDIKKAISMLDNYVPRAAMMSNNIENASKLLNNNRAFFSSVKNGTDKMLEVKGSSNEVYGIQMKKSKVNNRELFHKQTQFTKEDKMIKTYGKDALVNAGFNAASMVVGQYYMNEINNKLDTIQHNIQGISDFLDSEYQSKLSQIISKMKEIIDNKVEILNNSYSRDKRYNEVLRLESEGAKLLGQANEMIKKYMEDEDSDYKKYEKDMKNIYLWFIRQQILQQLLLEIGNLRYVLAYGNETSKLSHTQYNNYLIQTNNVNSELENWHKINCEKFGINEEEHKRKAKYFALRKNTIGKINEKWAYHKLEENVENIIKNQINIKKLTPYLDDKQNEKIKIQKYKGEYYNLLDDNS